MDLDAEPLIDNDDKDKPIEADEEKQPISEAPNEEKPPFSEASESSFGTDSDISLFSKDSTGKTKEWDEDKFVWR